MATKRLNAHLKKSEIKSLKALINGEVERIQSSFENDKEQLGLAESHHKDEVDSANDQILMSTTMRFSKRNSLYLKKLKKTLSLIDSDEYGMCEECGDAISYYRLKARPTSDCCINCKEEMEREENQNFFLRKSKSMGQDFAVN